MARFDDYLQQLQTWEGLQPIPLIRAWTPAETTAIDTHVRAAILASNFIGHTIPFRPGSTNQSKGNQAASCFHTVVGPRLAAGTQILPAGGAGYPDLLMKVGQNAYLLEAKASSSWDPGDANRRVLTSSSTKMRNLVTRGHVQGAPAHLIVTVFYNEASSRVTEVRLDFLEPDSQVNIRLEASTSHQLLSAGRHTVQRIP